MSAPLGGSAEFPSEPPASDVEAGTYEAAVRAWLDEHAPYGLMTTDCAFRIRGWNAWMETHTGRRASEMFGRGLADALPELVERRLLRYFEDAAVGQAHLLSQRLHGFLIRMPAEGGSGRYQYMQQSTQIAPLMHGQRIVGTVAMISDVTDRTAQEAALRSELATRGQSLADEHAARTAADLANRAKDEFLAVLSHELRTPLHAILGWTTVLREGPASPDVAARGLHAIERNAHMQKQLIEDLLDVSRIVSGNLRIETHRVNLRRPIEAAVEMLRPVAHAAGVVLTVSLDPSLRPIAGDASRLQQIVWNLLGNAVKFTPPGGQVSIVAQSHETHVSLVVRDTGRGIASEFLPHVFKRFAQADTTVSRQHEGLGLGLAIVKTLVELHGGTVNATSEGVGRGAVFELTLPYPDTIPGDSMSTPTKTGAHGAVASALGGLRVLVVDDNEDARDLMTIALSLQGGTVASAASAAEAREAIQREPPDVLISDVGMPGEDGYSLIAWIRATAPLSRIPAIALTGYAGLDAQGRAEQAGFNAHLTKPVDLDALAALVVTLATGAGSNPNNVR
jgi:signal transduction histidine kinase/ActR/RegA family two-component response regulator